MNRGALRLNRELKLKKNRLKVMNLILAKKSVFIKITQIKKLKVVSNQVFSKMTAKCLPSIKKSPRKRA